MLELLFLALYLILLLPVFAFIAAKLGALKERKCLLGKIGTCVAAAVFIFALVALSLHQCAVTIISFVLALLFLAAYLAIFFIEHKDLVKGCIGKVKARLLGKKQVTPISGKEKEDTFGVVEAIPAQEGENRNVGFYRITKGENGKCTFALLYGEGDNLSKEMGVFASEKDAARKINILREKGKGAKVEKRVKQTDVDLPAPKFVLDLNAVGEYRYSFLDEDGNVLLQSVSYLNEKRCLKDLKKALVCLTTENVNVDEGKLSEDEIEAVVPTKGFADGEKVKGAEASVQSSKDVSAEVVEDPASEFESRNTVEPAADGTSLKENIAFARTASSNGKIGKQYVAEYLEGKYGKGVRLNRRGNETKTKLPLADTHYVVKEGDKNSCFIYVYEIEGTLMLLVKVNDEYGKTLAEKHPNVKKSAFPKSEFSWYSVIVDDDFTEKDLASILDATYVMNGGEVATKS